MFNECLDIRWKTAHFCILNFSFKNDFIWEEISNIRHSVSSPHETPRSSSKILRCASYFQLSSRCFIWWWNTASHVWYIKRKSMFSFTSAKKREIRHFHVVVVQRQQRNVQKSVMHLQSCWFANLLLLFCRSRCRCRRCRRRRSLSSLFFWRKYAILHQRHSTTVSSSVNTLQILSELSRVLLDR